MTSQLPLPRKPKLYGWRKVVLGMIAAAELVGVAFAVLFGVQLLDAHVLGNVTGTKSPVFFWMLHAHPLLFLLMGLAGLALFAGLEALRTRLNRRWRRPARSKR